MVFIQLGTGIDMLFLDKGSCFSSSAVMDNENLSNLLQIPVLLKSPELIVESLFWIDEIISKTEEGTNKSLALTEAYKAEKLKLIWRLKQTSMRWLLMVKSMESLP